MPEISSFPATAAEPISSRPLYGPFYGLKERPFDLTADPRFLFLPRRHREAMSNLRLGLSTPRGLTLLLGDAGTGKTTLVRAALGELSDSNVRYVLISNPTLDCSEFYESLVRGFAFSTAALDSKTRFLSELQDYLVERYSSGRLTCLIVDEAQSLPYELLEEIRLLGNIETPTAKLLNIVLAGQPELASRLNEPSLRQLKQRVALRCELTPLTAKEAAAYMAGRIRIAGGSPADVFTREAVVAVHEASLGIPRTINVLCDNALLGGFAAELKPIPVRIVDEVIKDFDLAQPAASDDGSLKQASSPQEGESITTDSRPHLAGAIEPSSKVNESEGTSGFGPTRRFSFF